MSTNRPNASIWDDDEGEAQLRPMMRKNNAHLFDDEPPVSSLSAASAASAAAAVAGYTASSAAEANAASALSAPSAYSVGSASSALSARSAGSAHSAASASSAAVPSAASAAAPEAAGAAVSAPTPDSAGSAPLSARSGATPDAAPNAASAQSGAPGAASAPAMPPSQAPKSAPSAPVNGPVLGTTPSVHVPASSLANNGVPAMLANTPPATGRRYTNAENAHTSGTFDSAARRATATTAATSATASTGASALTAASAAAASVTAQSPASATSANAPELADAAKPAVADAGAANPGAVRRRSLFTAVPQPVPVDEDSDDETIQVPVVREDLIPDSFSAASAVSASAASASATSAAESASAAETVSAAETTSAAETSSSVSAASAPSSLEHSSAATSPASASDDVAPAPAAIPAPAVTVPTPESTVQADQEAVDSVQELNDAYEVEAAAVPLPTDFDAPSAISIPTPPHTVSSALSAESTFSIDSAVSAASAASSTGIILPTPAAPVTAAPPVPVTTAASAPVTASPATSSKANKLSDLPAPSDLPSPSEPAPAADVADLPAPPAPTGHGASAFTSDDEVVASDHTETTIMDAADMELEEVVKPVVTSTSPVGVERLDHLATADSADLAPVAPSPSSAIFASTRTAAFSDSANQSDADNEVDDDVLLAGSTVVGKPASRAAAHWGGTLLALVLFPIAWFLMHTAANALTGALADGWPKVFSTAGIIELGMAIVLLIVVMATATRSSLGTFVTGITTLLIGLPFVVVPSITKQYLGDFLANMALQSRFGRILSEAILLDGVSGRLVIIGLFLIMLGVVSHSTRRAGRRERLVMDRANTKK